MKAVGFCGRHGARKSASPCGFLYVRRGQRVHRRSDRSVGRALGRRRGLGGAFSSPPRCCVTAMAWLLFAVGLNLSGVYRVGGGFAGAGSSLAAQEGHWGSFFTGGLAILVATPCTAPIMAVAIASGLAAPPPVTVLIFCVMGFGLAAPYLALSAIPALGRAMPRPGPWMEVFRQFLAFPDIRRPYGYFG